VRVGREGQVDRSSGDWVLGVDIGTGSVKALAVTLDGRPLATSCVEHPMHHPRPGWAENDPDDWYRGLSATIREALSAAAVDPARIAGLGVVSQREPVVLTDAAGLPVAPSISWTDARATAEADEVAARFGRDWLIETTGMAPTHGMSLAHLLWYQRHRGDLWPSVRQIRFAKDYVLHRLTGCRATDPTTPSRSSLLDIRGLNWSEEVCNGSGIDPGLLPPIAGRPWEPAAELPSAQASELGLRPGLPVAMGGSDDASATLGCGAIEPGQAGVGTGTAANWRTVMGEYRADHSGAGDVSPHVVPDRFLYEVAIESTGSSLRWLRDTLVGPGGDSGFDELVGEAADVACGADGLLCFPFVDGASRAPWYADGARAAYLGVASGHTRAHLVRAMLEGIAYQYRSTMSILTRPGAHPGPLSASDPIGIGDGEARSPVWTQLKADVLGTPLRVPRIADLAAAGAAILAGLAAGVFEDAAAGVARLVRWDRQYDPDPERSAAYRELGVAYERAYQRVAQTFGRTAPAGTPGQNQPCGATRSD
jgi:sugar (pentulose or hexulose) kinase